MVLKRFEYEPSQDELARHREIVPTLCYAATIDASEASEQLL